MDSQIVVNLITYYSLISPNNVQIMFIPKFTVASPQPFCMDIKPYTCIITFRMQSTPYCLVFVIHSIHHELISFTSVANSQLLSQKLFLQCQILQVQLDRLATQLYTCSISCLAIPALQLSVATRSGQLQLRTEE